MAFSYSILDDYNEDEQAKARRLREQQPENSFDSTMVFISQITAQFEYILRS